MSYLDEFMAKLVSTIILILAQSGSGDFVDLYFET